MAQRELNILIKAENKASKDLQQLDGEVSNLSRTFQNSAADFKKAGAVITGVGVGLGALLYSTGKTAARTETMGVAMEAVAKATGTSMELIKEQEEALKKQGITTQASRNTLTKFMQSQLDVADASKVARIAQDLAVISGENSSQTTDRLTQAIASMNPELLRQVGIVKNMNEVFSEYGEKIGKEANDLTTLEKKQAMVNLIFEEGAKVAGTYEMAMDTVGKKMGSLDRHIEEARNAFGEAFLPIMALVVDKITELLKWFNKLSPELKETATKVVMVATAFALVVGPLLLVIGFLPAIASGFSILLGPVGLVIASITLLAGLFGGKLIKAFTDGNLSVSSFFQMIDEKTGIITILRNAWENVVLMFNERLMPALQRLWDSLEPLKPFLEVLAQVFGVILYGALIAVIKIIEISLIVAIEVLTRGINFATEAVDFFKSSWDVFVDTLARVITWIDKTIRKIKELNILQGAKDKISSFLGFGGGRATGGPVKKGTSYVVGEEGPELFTPNSNGSIIPNAKLRSAPSMSSGGVVINVYGDISGDELIDKVKRGIMGDLRMNSQISL